jgi:hypothetical protein
MSAVSSLTISLGLFYLLAAVAASALLRTSSAPFAFKVAGPAVLVFLACVTYRTLPDAFGYPVETTFSSLPQQAELIAFVPHDEDGTVVLWLREARQEQAQGQRTMLAKGDKPGNGRPGFIGIDGGNAPYELLPAAFQLPKKETGE